MGSKQSGEESTFPSQTGETVSVRQAARETGVSERTILRAVARADLDAHRRGRAYAITRASLNRFLERRLPGPRSLTPPHPALRLVPFPQTELPDAPAFRHPRSELIGRDREVTEILSLLVREDVPLVTLTGPGGVGKTRLALAVSQAAAKDFPGGVWTVPLAPVRDARLVARAIASALGIREEAHAALLDQLLRVFEDRRALLLLDNFEQVIEAAPVVAHLIESCPGLTILVTSRARLRLVDEHGYMLSPLGLTSPATATPGVPMVPDAVRLFVDRASAVQHDFDLSRENSSVILAICRRLDGLPLAIELAAPHVNVVPPEELLAHLQQRLPHLTRGHRDMPARQQTMRDTIAWSYNLLLPNAQRMFRQLAIFVGGFTFESVAGVCSQSESGTTSLFDGLAELIDASLLRQMYRPDGSARYFMLETVREFGLEQLAAAGMEQDARDAHAAWFVALDERLDPNDAPHDVRFDDALERIEAEHPNLRAALAHLSRQDDAGSLLRLAGALAPYWHHRGHLEEGRRWLESALASAPQASTPNRATALVGLSLIYWSQGENRLAKSLAYASHISAHQSGDTKNTALSAHMLSLAALVDRQLRRANTLMEAARNCWKHLGVRSSEAMSLQVLTIIAHERGDRARAVSYAEASVALFRAIGHSSGMATVTGRLARLAHKAGDLQRAVELFQEELQIISAIDQRWTAFHSRSGSAPELLDVNEPLYPHWASIDNLQAIVFGLSGLASIAAMHHQPEPAAILLGAVDARANAVTSQLSPSFRADFNTSVSLARNALGAERFAELHAQGSHLPLHDVLDIANGVSAPDSRSPSASASSPFGLTPRETDVLRLLVEGASNAEIANALFVSHRTARAHVANILAKLDVPTRTAAATLAVRRHLI